VDGDYIACAGSKGIISLWNFSSHEHLGDITVSNNRIPHLKAKGNLIVAGCGGGRVTVLDVDAKKEVNRWNACGDGVGSLDWQGDIILSSGHTDPFARMWRIGQEECIQQFNSSHPVVVCCFDSQQKKVLFYSHWCIKVFDVETGREEKNIQIFAEEVMKISTIPGEKGLIIIALAGGCIEVWDYNREVKLHTLQEVMDSVDYFLYHAWQLYGDYLLAGGESNDEGRLWVWNWRTGALLHTLHHPASVTSVDCDGDVIVSADGFFFDPLSKSTIRVWDWQTGEMLSDITSDYPYSFDDGDDEWDAYEQRVFIQLHQGKIVECGENAILRVWDFSAG